MRKLRRRAKRMTVAILKWAIWNESRLMSLVHVFVDWLASGARRGNTTIWKKMLLKSLTLYYYLDKLVVNGNGDQRDRKK